MADEWPEIKIDLFSPLYSRYNGFMLGQFVGGMFAGFAREMYPIHRARVVEFLEEIGAAVTFPEEPVPFGSDAYNELMQQVIITVAKLSKETAEFALLALNLIFFGYSEAASEMAALSEAEIRRLIAAYRLPELDLVTFQQSIPRDPEAEPPIKIDDVLSPSLAYLAQVVEEMAIEPETAFVIMPFSQPYAGYYQTFYRPSMEQAGFRAFRAWGGLSWENYADLLVKLIAKSGIVLADISEGNRNVFYEIGAAHAFGKLSVLIVAEPFADQWPANIGHDPVSKYSTDDDNWPAFAIRHVALMANAMRLAAERDKLLRIGPEEVRQILDSIAETIEEFGVSDLAEYYRRQGMEAYERGEFRAAETAIEIAIALGLEDVQALLLRGIARLQLEKYGAAQADLEQVIAGGLDMAEVRQLLGFARHYQDDNLGAIGDFSLAIEQEPEDPTNYYLRGVAFQMLGRHAESEADFTRAIAAGQANAEIYQRRAFARIRLNRVPEAVQDRDQAIMLGAGDPATQLCKAQVALGLGNYDQAVAGFRANVEGEASAENRLELALALLLADHHQEALTIYQQTMVLSSALDIEQASRELTFWSQFRPERFDSEEGQRYLAAVQDLLATERRRQATLPSAGV